MSWPHLLLALNALEAFGQKYGLTLFREFRAKIPSAAKYPLPPKSGRFCEGYFIRFLDLCYVNTAYTTN